MVHYASALMPRAAEAHRSGNIATGVSRDVVPAMALLRSLIYLLASLTVTVFFYFFQRAQGR